MTQPNTKKSRLITVAGPSCTGKTVMADLLKPFNFSEIVSTTTRPMREGEVNGKSYHFVNKDKFEEMITNGDLIEYSLVNEKHYYGVSKAALQEFLDSGKDGILVIEPFGSANVRKYCEGKDIELHQVFLNNPLNLLVERMLTRFKNDGLAKPENYVRRLKDMIVFEQENWVKKAYSGEHKYEQVFDSFNNENQIEVVNSVLKNAGFELQLSNPKDKTLKIK